MKPLENRPKFSPAALLPPAAPAAGKPLFTKKHIPCWHLLGARPQREAPVPSTTTSLITGISVACPNMRAPHTDKGEQEAPHARAKMGDDEHTEITLSTLREAHVYKLPPRPSAGGWKCQEWPKGNHIFTARVKIVARGAQCMVRFEDQT